VTPDDFIYFEMTNDILVTRKRTNYFDYEHVDLAMDFKEWESTVGIMKSSKINVNRDYYKLD
jgi:hypothetical protein